MKRCSERSSYHTSYTSTLRLSFFLCDLLPFSSVVFLLHRSRELIKRSLCAAWTGVSHGFVFVGIAWVKTCGKRSAKRWSRGDETPAAGLGRYLRIPPRRKRPARHPSEIIRAALVSSGASLYPGGPSVGRLLEHYSFDERIGRDRIGGTLSVFSFPE